MLTSAIGQFPLYIFEANEEVPDDIDPMCYQVLMKATDNSKVYRAICQAIPCSYCELHSTCSPGSEQTHICHYVRDNFPELAI